MKYLLSCIVAFTLACAADAGTAADYEPLINVENGVTTVVNPSLLMADSTSWSIDTTPAVRIGIVDGAREYMIGELAGMQRRSDGSIVIADAAAHELRLFNDSGMYVRSGGGVGAGPGEFGWMTHLLAHAGDTVVAMDREGSRVTVLDAGLQPVRRYLVALTETDSTRQFSSPHLLGFFSDGSQLVSNNLDSCQDRGRREFCEDSVAFVRTDQDGNVLSQFGRFVNSRSERWRLEQNIWISEPHPQAFWRIHGASFYYADAKRFEVKVFRMDGTLERVVRVNTKPPSYSRSDVFPGTSFLKGAPESSSGADLRAALDKVYEQVQMPDSMPAFSDMLVDNVGNIWLREYLPPVPLRTIAPRWFIFDSNGRLRYSLRSPRFLVRPVYTFTTIHPRVFDDAVLTRLANADGVESVALFRVEKRGKN